MEEVIESFRDGFIPHQFEHSQNQSPYSVNNVLILMSLVTIAAVGYVCFKLREENEEFTAPKKF